MARSDNPYRLNAQPVPLAQRAEILSVPRQPTAALTPLSPLTPLATSTGNAPAPMSPVISAPDLTSYAPPTMPLQAMPPPVMPLTVSPVWPPPGTIGVPTQRTPRTTRVRRKGPSPAARFIPFVVVGFIVLSVFANNHSSSDTDVSTPQITIPTFKAPTFKVPKLPDFQSKLTVDLGLITMGASEQIYETLNNHYTTSAAAMRSQGFTSQSLPHYSIGVSRGQFCIVGSDERSTFWRLYDTKANYVEDSKTFATESRAKAACPFRVRWGRNGHV